MFYGLLFTVFDFFYPFMVWMLAQVVTDVGGSTASNVVVWGSLVSGIGIAAGSIIAAYFQGASKLRESDQKSSISDLNHEIERLRSDVEDYKARWREERDARLRAEADLERQRVRDQS
jgi:hypothetical protein